MTDIFTACDLLRFPGDFKRNVDHPSFLREAGGEQAPLFLHLAD